jgi:hypothetical protein
MKFDKNIGKYLEVPKHITGNCSPQKLRFIAVKETDTEEYRSDVCASEGKGCLLVLLHMRHQSDGKNMLLTNLAGPSGRYQPGTNNSRQRFTGGYGKANYNRLLLFGDCLDPGVVVSVILANHDSSEKFFERSRSQHEGVGNIFVYQEYVRKPKLLNKCCWMLQLVVIG